ncbi:FAD synthase-like isoform X1 [Neodiprion fabricii]|uniref:FAD synthase-like isoform X1 n=2 Tax=Neodiprion fabricii TaxID=2872261 RepID=UPI001ED8D739|nr:FAD synthase-like isoform X1 [Neodiprion fabricii]XP_046423667.1 FAD synthase-like isoform X1 [Neodiprion fabricii]
MATACRNILRGHSIMNLNRYSQVLVAKYGHLSENPTAGIIIIGDEILKAQVKDTNSNYICRLLYNCGVKVKKISVVSDEVDRIAEEMVNFSEKYTYVITSGGIGPTHDDVTFEALAKAFNDSLHHHPKLVEVVKTFSSSQDISSPGYKLAYIPMSASLTFGKSQETGERLFYPCVSVKNVHVFPGSPIFLHKSFGNVYKELFATGRNFVTKEIYLGVREELFADALSAVSKEFSNVTFGSYPTSNHSYYHARVTVESSSEDDTNKAVARFRDLAPENAIVNYDNDPLTDALRKFKAFVAVDKQGPIYEATLTTLKEIYSNPSNVAVCFDGSIESTVLLHLVHVNNLLGAKAKLQAVHLKLENPVADVDEFIKETVVRYDVNLHHLDGSAEAAIENLAVLRPEIETLLLGLKGDKLEGGLWHEFAKSGSIGQIRLISPLTKWSYKDVWNFARSLSLPYCKLYDRGYTSLGSQTDTEPNPNLLKGKIGKQMVYHPAHMLADVKLERAGRIPQDHPEL